MIDNWRHGIATDANALTACESFIALELATFRAVSSVLAHLPQTDGGEAAPFSAVEPLELSAEFWLIIPAELRLGRLCR